VRQQKLSNDLTPLLFSLSFAIVLVNLCQTEVYSSFEALMFLAM